jgi:hypothetical protein
MEYGIVGYADSMYKECGFILRITGICFGREKTRGRYYCEEHVKCFL